MSALGKVSQERGPAPSRSQRDPRRRAGRIRARLGAVDARRVGLVCGVIFVPAGLVKFAFHHWELQAFRDFGIPAASVMEPLVGVLETVGGLLLIRGVLIVPTAVVLAVIMLVAFVAGGIIHASPIPSDTLAPALLAAMIYLIRAGPRERLRVRLGWQPGSRERRVPPPGDAASRDAELTRRRLGDGPERDALVRDPVEGRASRRFLHGQPVEHADVASVRRRPAVR